MQSHSPNAGEREKRRKRQQDCRNNVALTWRIGASEWNRFPTGQRAVNQQAAHQECQDGVTCGSLDACCKNLGRKEQRDDRNHSEDEHRPSDRVQLVGSNRAILGHSEYPTRADLSGRSNVSRSARTATNTTTSGAHSAVKSSSRETPPCPTRNSPIPATSRLCAAIARAEADVPRKTSWCSRLRRSPATRNSTTAASAGCSLAVTLRCGNHSACVRDGAPAVLSMIRSKWRYSSA